jgi:hypothetical protein
MVLIRALYRTTGRHTAGSDAYGRVPGEAGERNVHAERGQGKDDRCHGDKEG